MRERNLNTMLLVDDYSRVTIKGNIAELSSLGVEVINTLRDITPSIVAKTNKLILLDGCMRKSAIYSDLILYKELFDLEYYFLSLDESLVKSMESIATCYAIDPSSLNYDRVYSIVYDDPIARSNFISDFSISDVELLAKELISNPNNKVRRISEAYLSASSLLVEKETKIRELLQEIDILQTKHQQSQEYASNLKKYHHSLLDSAIDMSRSLSQYQVIFTKDVYDKVRLNQFSKRPKIIYLKEYEEMLYLESFIDTLSRAIRLHNQSNVKVIQLFDSSASRKVIKIPDKYAKLEHGYHERDIYTNDFMVKVGAYQEIMSTLLTNIMSVDTLIVVDRKDHSDTILQGGSFLQLGLCRNVDRCSTYGLIESETITNSVSSELSWSFFPEYSKLVDDETDKDRFIFLSNRPVIQKILEMHRSFRR